MKLTRFLLFLFVIVTWQLKASNHFEDKIVSYVQFTIESVEKLNQTYLANGEYSKINRTLIFDFNQVFSDEPRILLVSAQTEEDVSDQYPQTKKLSDQVNLFQDKILFYNVIIKNFPKFFEFVKEPYQYRYGDNTNSTARYGILNNGYYTVNDYYGYKQTALLQILKNAFERVSALTLPDQNKIFNFFATTQVNTLKNGEPKLNRVNFIHTEYEGEIFNGFKDLLNIQLQGDINTANTDVFSSPNYSNDAKMKYQLSCSIKALKEVVYMETTAWEYIFPEGEGAPGDEAFEGTAWYWEYWDEKINLQAGHLLMSFLSDNGFECKLGLIPGSPSVTKVLATQEMDEGGSVEYEVVFHEEEGREAIKETLIEWGMSNEYSYQFYIFYTNAYENIGASSYATWLDIYGLKTPPFVVELIARIVAGPAVAIYGYWSGRDAFNGHVLEGWEHALHVLDLVPLGAAFTSLVKTTKVATKLGVASMKIYNAAGTLIGNSTKIKSFVQSFLTKSKKFVSSSGHILSRFVDGAERFYYVQKVGTLIKPFFELLVDGTAKLMNVLPKGARHDKVIGELGQFTVKTLDGTVVEKYVKIVRTSDGQIYIKSYDNVTGMLAGYPTILAWYNKIPAGDEFTVYRTMIEDIPVNKLAALEADFVNPAFRELAASNPWFSHAWLATSKYPLIRTNGSELLFVEDYLLSSGKNFDKVADEITNAGGYSAWKVWVSRVGSVFKVGDNIAGKIVQNVKTGTNGKIAVIGRKMDGHVNDVVSTLQLQGKQVEAFSESFQFNKTFNIDGQSYTWQQIKDDFANPINPLTGQRKYTSINQQGWIADSDVPNTLMYKANEQWAQKLINDGYEIIDIGYPAGQNLDPSLFYNMELSIIFP